MNNIYQRLRGVNWIPSVLAACAMLLIAGQQEVTADPITASFDIFVTGDNILGDPIPDGKSATLTLETVGPGNYTIDSQTATTTNRAVLATFEASGLDDGTPTEKLTEWYLNFIDNFTADNITLADLKFLPDVNTTDDTEDPYLDSITVGANSLAPTQGQDKTGLFDIMFDFINAGGQSGNNFGPLDMQEVLIYSTKGDITVDFFKDLTTLGNGEPGFAAALHYTSLSNDESAKYGAENWDPSKDSAVPEPASMALMGLGSLLAGCGVIRRKRKNMAEELSS